MQWCFRVFCIATKEVFLKKNSYLILSLQRCHFFFCSCFCLHLKQPTFELNTICKFETSVDGFAPFFFSCHPSEDLLLCHILYLSGTKLEVRVQCVDFPVWHQLISAENELTVIYQPLFLQYFCSVHVQRFLHFYVTCHTDLCFRILFRSHALRSLLLGLKKEVRKH